ncbi:hypothetical protein HHK36_024655 [Tetracentron sinense]|uniref:LysM domain-containing protein n=1 Tax=Tetracentron sinense TaxID=13715 RepID=A0A835D4G0_TETSI|nr:hypothetical protein HHK36_024655 [Tetracentron sinense]
MRNQVLLLLLLLSLIFIFPCIISAKSVIEPCKSSDSCSALLSYLLPWDSELSEIASRFQVNISDFLASNGVDPTKPFAETQILPAKSLTRVPISCPCVDGIRRSLSTIYTVQEADTLDSISVGYGGLVSAEQIRSVNGINGKDPVASGQSLVIPLPCTCFNNLNNGITVVYLSYVVERGESLSSIGADYGTTVTNLEAVNGLEQPVIDPGDILAVPIPACSSANLDWRNESMIIPNGSYALTANNCIKCTCGPGILHIRCFPSGFAAVSCSHLQCKGSSLFIGDIYEKQSALGCNVSTCLYRGHYGRKIFRSLVNSSQNQCSGNQSHSILAPTSPAPHGSIIPLVTVSPSPSPSSASNRSVTIVSSDPTSKQDSTSSDGGSDYCAYLCFEIILPLSSFSLCAAT